MLHLRENKLMNSNNLFLNNKYTKRYYNIIENARVRYWKGYTETHHIIPRCLGGNNDKSNLIALTGHEHLVCHLLLRKMLPDGQNNGVIAAAWRMVNIEDENGNRHRVTGRVYAKLKEEFAKAHSVTMKGRTPWNKGRIETRPEVLKNIQDAALARPEQSKESRELQASKTRGQKRSNEQKNNISTSLKGKLKGPMSQSQKDAISAGSTGVKKCKEHGQNLSATIQKQLAEGTHNTKIRVSCINTHKEYSLSTFTRYVLNKET
jgi:gas vesicle protein